MLRLIARPGRAEETIEALRVVMLPVQLEGGAARTLLSSEVGTPEAICYVEEWPTADALAADIRTHRFSRLLALMETAAEVPTLEFRFVTETRGLEYVEAVLLEAARPATG